MNSLTRSTFAVVFLLPSLLQNSQAAEKMLGTVFYTPEQRQAITKARQEGPASDQGSSKVRLDGMLRSASGQTVAWVNGQEVAPPGQRPGTAAVSLQGATVMLEHQRSLKVGQSAFASGVESPVDLVPPGSIRTGYNAPLPATQLVNRGAADGKGAPLQLTRSKP